jgi:hypothetical protein
MNARRAINLHLFCTLLLSVAVPFASANEQPLEIAATPAKRTSTRAFIEELSNSLGLSLPAMQQKLEKASSPQSKFIIQLGMAAWHSRHNNFREAISILEKSENRDLLELRDAHDILLAEAYLRNNEPQKAALALAEIARDTRSVFHKRASALYFQSLVASENGADATRYLSENKRNILASADSITLLTEKLVLSNQTFSEEERLEIARRLMRDFGSEPRLRETGFKIAGIDEKNIVPQTPVDELAENEKMKLLAAADLLVSAWEYTLALQVLNKLAAAKLYGDHFTRFKVLSLLGRALNATERYSEAIAIYEEAMRAAKTNRDLQNARDRYLLSLHFFQDFDAEAKAIKAIVKKEKRAQRDINLLWRLFWAEYLAERYDEAWKTGSLLEQRFRGKQKHSPLAHAVLYWKARMLENQDDEIKARASYASIISGHSESHYATLAKWRLELLNEKPNSNASRVHIPLQKSDLPASLLSAKSEKEENSIRLVQDLTDAGLFRFATPLFESIRFSGRTKSEALGSAEKALSLQKFRRSISLVEGIGTEKYAKGLSPKQLQKWMTTDPAFWRAWFPVPYPTVFRPAALEYGVSESLVWSIARKESLFETTAISSVGAMGLMQIMPRTGYRISKLIQDNEYQPSDLLRPEVNIVYGSWYLARLTQYYQGNEILAAAAYNAGPVAVDRWIRQNPELELDEFLQNIPFDQTRDYVAKIIRYMDTYLRFYSQSEYILPRTVELPSPITSLEIF